MASGVRGKRNATNSTGAAAGSPFEIETRTVPVSSLRPHPDNTYSMDRDSIETLAENIRQVGLIELPYVREVDDGGLQILSGHRRIRALKILAQDDPAYSEVEVRVAVGMSDADALFVLHSANIFRPVSAAERIRQADELKAEVARLRDSHPEWRDVPTRQIIAQMLGIGKTTFVRKLKLANNLEPELHEMYESGMLSTTVANDLADQNRSYQRRFRKYVERKAPRDKRAVSACYDAFTRPPSKLVATIGEDISKLESDILQLRVTVSDGIVAVDTVALRNARSRLDKLISEAESGVFDADAR